MVHFTAPEPANWVIKPGQASVILALEGSQLAQYRAQSLLHHPLIISVPAGAGRQTVDLLDRLRRSDELGATGVSVVSADPRYAEIELDQIERFTVPVKPLLPGVVPEGEVVLDVPEVTVAMPSQLRQRLGQRLVVEAPVERSELDRMQPGVQQAHDVKLRLPESLGPLESVWITPSRAKVTFTIRSRTRETTLDSVRVQLAGPPEDREQYVVEIDPKQIRNVTVSADADLIRRIEANEVPVVAVLHVGSREKEARIESKRISYFIALVPEANGGTRGVPVTGKVGDSNELPAIKLRIVIRGEE